MKGFESALVHIKGILYCFQYVFWLFLVSVCTLLNLLKAFQCNLSTYAPLKMICEYLKDKLFVLRWSKIPTLRNVWNAGVQ